jgi:uncharacterized membrane protein
VRAAIFIGRQRTVAQDAAFGFRQLVDIAVRALSPGINDPTTACNAVDYLGSLLAAMADRPWPSSSFSGDDGIVRLRLPAATFADYVTLAFTEVRRYGSRDIAVTLRLFDALGVAGIATDRPDRRAALWREACTILDGTRDGFPVASDRRRIDDAFRRLAAELDEDSAGRLPPVAPTTAQSATS